MKPGQIVSRFAVDGKEAIVRYPKHPKYMELAGIVKVVQDHRSDHEFMGSKKGRVSAKMKSWWMRQIVTNKKPNLVTLILEIDGEIQGVVTIGASYDWRLDYAPWWLNMVIIHRKYRGKGIGQKLLLSAISETKKYFGAERIGLMVAEPNEPAAKLYLNLSFVVVGARQNELKWQGKPVDGFILIRRVE